MADIFAEADEALRRERMAAVWARYKFLIIGFILATIVMTGAVSTYRKWDVKEREKQTATLIALQEAKDYPDNILKSEPEMRPALKAILTLDAAAKFIEKKNTAGALTLYERVSADKSAPPMLRDLGTLMAVRLQLDEGKTEAKDLLARLAPITADKNNPWAPHAGLETAVITANAQQNFEEAQKILNAVLDTPGLPQSLYEKAQSLSHVYRLKNAGKTAAQNDTAKPDSKS